MSQLVFVPEGGLANRMRSMCSALSLAHQTGSRLRVVWFRDWALNAPFSALFEPLPEVEEAGFLSGLTLDRPRRRNFYIPALYQHLVFSKRMYSAEVDRQAASHFDFAGWVSGCNVYLSSYMTFHPFSDTDYRRYFRPLPATQQAIDCRVTQFGPYTIGVHVRRSDHKLASDVSTTELFVAAIDAELREHDELQIYLATDSEEVKRTLKGRYGNRLLCSEQTADRNSSEGIREAIAEMFTLAHTQRIYGSFRSSFSNMAAKLGGKELVVVKGADVKESGVTF